MKWVAKVQQLFKINDPKTKPQEPKIAPHLSKLGFRLVLVDCLLYQAAHGDPYHPAVLAAANNLQEHYEQAYREIETSPFRHDQNYRQILEASLVSFGHQELIEAVLDALPDEPGMRTGICIACSSQILGAVLPLPENFHCGYRLICDKQKIKVWYAVNRANLRWEPSLDRYIMTNE